MLKSNTLITRLFPVILILFCFLNANESFASSLKKGVYFYSHTSDIDKRTSLILNDGKPYKLQSKDQFALEFDVSLRKEDTKFGYLFRVISNLNENFDLVINNHNEIYFVHTRKDFYKKEILLSKQSFNVKLLFDKQNNEIILSLDGDSIIYSHDLSATKSLLINFGECDIKPYVTRDVPPMILNNVIVSNRGKQIHRWSFNRYKGSIVYDDIKNKPAILRNGKMLIDNSLHWQKIGELTTRNFPQIAFDSIRNKVIVLNDSGCINFSIVNYTTELIQMKNSPVNVDLYTNRLIYDHVSDKLLSYTFVPENLNYYHSDTHSWKESIEEKPYHAHHNRYISKIDTSLYLFGGYGFHQYNNDFFKVDLKNNKWEKWDLSSIMPRYLSAMGSNSSGEKLYILGGKGTQMGYQELSPQNVSDLHEIDLSTKSSKLIYELSKNETEDDYVFSNSLVIDDKDEYLYVLAYPNASYQSNITLKRINLTKPEMETYGDTIEFYFYDIASSCDLFYSPSLSKLIAVASSSLDRISSTVDIYSLDFPPLKESDVSEIETINLSAIIWTILSIIALLALITFFIRYRKKEKSENMSVTETKSESVNMPVDTFTESINDLFNTQPEEKYYNRTKSSIIFLGGFQVYDKDGKDITEEFSPTLKYLLVLILLYTLKNQKGISSLKLEELLWFGKSEKAARNNRNVNLRKLRMILENVGDVVITNKNSYWDINISGDLFSDYYEVLGLIEQIKASSAGDPEKVKRLLELLSYGEMLPNIQFEWIDNFKSDFANLVIDILLYLMEMKKQAMDENQLLLLKITDVILMFDPINEDAIAIKCQVLYHLGKKTLAQTVYNNFTRDYQAILGENYNVSLKNLMGKEE